MFEHSKMMFFLNFIRSIGSLNYLKKKMVSVASAFVGCPPLSILDDPLDGLERPDRDRMCNAINSLKCRGLLSLNSKLMNISTICFNVQPHFELFPYN